MKLATIDDGSRDGRLARVSTDLAHAVFCDGIARTLQAALDDWAALASRLAALDPAGPDSFAFDPARALAPLPRAWQWLDGSAFTTHGELLQQAYGLPAIPTDPPLMYQGMSHRFLPGHADVPLPREEDGIDFEAEYGVIVDDVPMGTPASGALEHVRLVMLINDWSLRTIGAAEMRTGFGWVQAKPACSAAPVVVTPDELGDAWQGGRIRLPVMVEYNGLPFGMASGAAMDVGFHDLIAHAARTRDLCAGTIIGSGTVSNRDYRTVGSSCIAERRAVETIEGGAAVTDFMHFGNRVRITVAAEGRSIFGAIDQAVRR